MPVTFPAIRPTDRRLTPGTVPQSVTRAINGRTVRRPMASHQGGMRLEVEFTNRPDSEVEAIRQVRNAAKTDPVLLPDELFAGDPELLVFVKFLPPDTAWRFSGDVEVEWAKRGRATVRVAFVNYRRTVFTLPPPPEIEVPPLPPVVHQFMVSETTSAVSVDTQYSQAIVTAAGSIYWTGRATINSTARYFLNKYDSDGNLLWGRWLEGDYSSGYSDGVGNTWSEPVLCEGPGDGVFVAVQGLAGGNINDFGAPYMGSSMRIHLFNTEGSLATTAAWQFANNGNGRAKYEDKPAALFYQPTENKLYVAGAGHSLTVLRALTLDQPYGIRRNPSNGQESLLARWLWLPSKQRVVAIGYQPPAEQGGQGFWLREFSPDLRTQYQAYTYGATYAGSAFGVDAFGSVYHLGVQGNSGSPPFNALLTKLSSSDGGYMPVWTRSWPIPMPADPINAGALQGASIDFLPDGSLVVTITIGNTNAPNGNWWHLFTCAPDIASIVATTTLKWGQSTPPYNILQGPRIDPIKQQAVLTSFRFSLMIASLRLPTAATSLPVTSTITNGLVPKAIAGQTNYTAIPLTDAPAQLPTRTAWTQPLVDLNPMVPWAEPGWSTSDLTATVNMALKSTGPLQIP